MKVTKKEPEAHLYDGSNYEELKKDFPELIIIDLTNLEGVNDIQRRRELPEMKEGDFQYRDTPSVGWLTDAGFMEALPGYYLIKNDGPNRIISPDEFKIQFSE